MHLKDKNISEAESTNQGLSFKRRQTTDITNYPTNPTLQDHKTNLKSFKNPRKWS